MVEWRTRTMKTFGMQQTCASMGDRAKYVPRKTLLNATLENNNKEVNKLSSYLKEQENKYKINEK